MICTMRKTFNGIETVMKTMAAKMKPSGSSLSLRKGSSILFQSEVVLKALRSKYFLFFKGTGPDMLLLSCSMSHCALPCARKSAFPLLLTPFVTSFIHGCTCPKPAASLWSLRFIETSYFLYIGIIALGQKKHKALRNFTLFFGDLL